MIADGSAPHEASARIDRYVEEPDPAAGGVLGDFPRWIAERTDGPAPLFEKVEPGDEQPLGSSTVASLGAHLAAPEISARVPEVVKIRLDDLEEQARGKTLEGLASRQILSQPFP
jgi:hypothetical protein